MPPKLSMPLQFRNPVWKVGRIKPKQAYNRLNHARRSVCPRSPFWCEDFDLDQHKQDLEDATASKNAHATKYKDMEASWAAYHASIGMSSGPYPPSPMRPAFDGRPLESYTSDRSAVLLEHTVFSDLVLRAEAGYDEARWPCKEELQFEGHGRVATERIHGRFLPLPREIFPESSPWQERAPLVPSALDTFSEKLLSDEEIWFKFWWIPGVEFTDQVTGEIDDEGVHALGAELIALLDPRDQY